MANDFTSNFTRKLLTKVAERFEANRVISKNVNTQLFAGGFDPNSGDTIDIKRPTDFKTIRSSDGDIGSTKRDIITGKASAVVQDYITVPIDFKEADQAIKMGTDMDRFFDDTAIRIVTDLEIDFANFAVKNVGLLQGTVNQGVDSWAEVAGAGALMQSSGVPINKKWAYFLNPYSQVALATEQKSLGVNPQAGSALENATVASSYAGFDVMTATTLPTVTMGTMPDMAGAVNGAPTPTYAGAKDSMTQSIIVDGMGTFSGTVPAGSVVQVTGVNRLNLATRKPIVDASGNSVVYTGTVTADATLTSGAGTLIVAGPAIYEATGAYNTVERAIADNDVITILGTSATTQAPNLFWHPDAFSITSVPMEKLFSTDTIYTSTDGLQIRCSKYADGDANKQTVRFDLRPAYGAINPFLAGQGFGTA